MRVSVAPFPLLLAVVALTGCASAPPALPPPQRANVTQIYAAPAPPASASAETAKAAPAPAASDINLTVAQIIARGLGPPQIPRISRLLRAEALLRQQPQNTSNVISTLTSGSAVQPISQLVNHDGNWWYVQVGDVTGWVPTTALAQQ